jgi:hypothetical protein
VSFQQASYLAGGCWVGVRESAPKKRKSKMRIRTRKRTRSKIKSEIRT